MTDTQVETEARSGTPWTPGPWLMAEGNATALVYALDERGEVNRFSARIEGGYVEHWRRSKDASQRTSDSEVAAIARLVWAAPDLYEALDHMVSIYDGMEDGMGEPCPALANARAALARARGEQS